MLFACAHSPAHIIAHFLHVCMSFGQNYWPGVGEGVGDGVDVFAFACARVHVHVCVCVFFFLLLKSRRDTRSRGVRRTDRARDRTK